MSTFLNSFSHAEHFYKNNIKSCSGSGELGGLFVKNIRASLVAKFREPSCVSPLQAMIHSMGLHSTNNETRRELTCNDKNLLRRHAMILFVEERVTWQQLKQEKQCWCKKSSYSAVLKAFTIKQENGTTEDGVELPKFQHPLVIALLLCVTTDFPPGKCRWFLLKLFEFTSRMKML